MESKFIVFVVIAALTQSSSAQQPSTVYGLSEEKTVQFYRIIDNQKSTISSVFGALDRIFDTLEILAVKRKYNLQCECIDHRSLIAEGLVEAKKGCDFTFNSIPTISEESKVAIESARIGANEDLQNIYTQISNAIDLAKSGNYETIRIEIDSMTTAAKTSSRLFMRRLYDSLRNGMNIVNAGTLAAMKIRETESTENVYRTCDAIFDAIRVFASNILYTEKSVARVIVAINDYRDKASNGLKNYVENNFSPFRGLYISHHLEQPDLAANLIANQYAEILSAARYQESAALLFNVVRIYLNKIELGIFGHFDDDFSEIDIAQAKSAENFKAALRALVESVPTTDPVTRTAAQAALQFFNTFSDTSAVAYYGAIRIALTQGSTLADTLAKLHVAKTTFLAGFPAFVRTVFTVVQLGSKDQSGIQSLQENALQAGYRYVDNIFNAAELLAKARHGAKTVTKEDFKSLETGTSEAGYAVGTFTSNISTGHLTLFKAFKAILGLVKAVPTAVVSHIATDVKSGLKVIGSIGSTGPIGSLFG